MESLLQYAYVEQHCNACGGSYRVTLYEALNEHRVQQEWQSGRNCSLCSVSGALAVSAIPPDVVENLNDAWEQVVRAAANAEVNLQVGS